LKRLAVFICAAPQTLLPASASICMST